MRWSVSIRTRPSSTAAPVLTVPFFYSTFTSLSDALRNPVRVLGLFALLQLAGCATAPVALDNPDWERHRQQMMELSGWQLSGRLNVRQNGRSDTVQINWQQQHDNFDLRLSGTLGLGAVYIHGNPGLVTVEKASEPAQVLPGLDALNREYFGYDFPTAELLYWIRGIPAPDLPAATTLDENLMLATLEQTDADGERWTLTYDRYQPSGDVYLPGRIRVSRDNLALTFLIDNWEIPDAAAPELIAAQHARQRDQQYTID